MLNFGIIGKFQQRLRFDFPTAVLFAGQRLSQQTFQPVRIFQMGQTASLLFDINAETVVQRVSATGEKISLFRSLYRVSATWSYVLQLVPVFTLLKANWPVVRIVQDDSLQVHQFWQNARRNRQRNQFLRVQSNVSGKTDIIIQSKCYSRELRQSFYTHETLLRHNFPVSMFRGNSSRGSTASVYRCRNACKW